MRQQVGGAPSHVGRSVVLAFLAAGTASVAHGVAGGHLPSVWGTAALVAALTWLALPFTRGRLSLARSGMVLLALQAVAHVANSLVTMGAHTTGPVALATAHHHGKASLAEVSGAVPVTDPEIGASMGLVVPGPWMVLAHVVAAAAMVAVLVHAESAWVRTLELPGAVLTAVVAVLHHPTALLARHAPVGAPSSRVAECVSWTPSPWRRTESAVRRGPPALLAA